MIKSKKLTLIIGMLIGMTSLTSCGSSSEETAKTAETLSQTAETTVPMTETEHETAEETPANPVATFKVESLENLHLGEDFLLENYYITNRTMAGNRFYIDENGALWGYGSNYYGQLGTVMACGADLGDQTKTIAVSGDLIAEETRKYSTAFIPVELVEYSSDEYNREVLDKCKTGMSSDDVEKILTDGNFSYEWGSMIAEDNDLKYITAENNRYILYFDAELKLEQIIFQDDLAFTEEN